MGLREVADRVNQECVKNHTVTAKYITGKKLGSGTYGTVYLATDKDTGHRYAIKKLLMDSSEGCIPASAIREIGIILELNNFKCDNIIRIHEVLHQRRQISIVYELAEWDLKELMDKFSASHLENKIPRRCLPDELARSFVGQLLDGLIVCHKHCVIHRDLKPSNILITTYGVVKITDFGLSRTSSIPNRTLCHEVVTLWYRAPEVLLGTKKYGHSIDVWSFGCIVYEMVQGKVLFPGDCEIGQLYLIFRKLGTPTTSTWSDFKDLPNFNSEFPKFSPAGFEEDFHINWEYIIQNTVCMNPEERCSLEWIRGTVLAEKRIIPLHTYISRTK
ncbi:unnamed protein product [Heterobilharzia americana]|nr:unnamed protein product [Heterobilharzia americana]CAH8546284.1 unnamed protein product [Heterobilharzia americana]